MHPRQPSPPTPCTDYRESGNTGAVLVIAPTMDFEFVCFAPLRPGAAAAAGGEAASGVSSPPRKALPDGTGVYVYNPCVQGSPFAAQAGAPLGQVAGEAAVDAALTPAAHTMQQVRCRRRGWVRWAPVCHVSPRARVACTHHDHPALGRPPRSPLLQEAAEEQVVMHQVEADQGLAGIVRKRSGALQELEELVGDSRVPAVALARKSLRPVVPPGG